MFFVSQYRAINNDFAGEMAHIGVLLPHVTNQSLETHTPFNSPHGTAIYATYCNIL